MGIFNKPAQQADIQTDTTVIAGSTSIEGDIESSCPLQIDGAHVGTIEAKSTVTIGQKGKVEGELSANTLSVTGTFQGIIGDSLKVSRYRSLALFLLMRESMRCSPIMAFQEL